MLTLADKGWGLIQMLTFADRVGVKNGLQYIDVILAWSLIMTATKITRTTSKKNSNKGPLNHYDIQVGGRGE